METCVVGCKLPHGLNLDLVLAKDADGKPTKAQRILLKGKNSAHIVGGYGLTHNVPKEPFERWLVENSARPFVKNGSVFMQDSEKNAKAAARERRAERTGFESIDPTSKTDPRVRGLEHDKDSLKVLGEQRAKNPDRNRQIVE